MCEKLQLLQLGAYFKQAVNTGSNPEINLRSHEKYNSTIDLKGDDLIRKEPFTKAEKSIAVGSGFYLTLLF